MITVFQGGSPLLLIGEEVHWVVSIGRATALVEARHQSLSSMVIEENVVVLIEAPVLNKRQT